jgi:hypothetical protein
MHSAEKFHIKQEAMNSLQSVIHHLRKVLTYDKKSETIVELKLLNESHSEMNVELLNVSHFNFSCISTDESDVAEHIFHKDSDDDDEPHFSYTSLVNPLKAIISTVNSKLISPIVDPLNWFPKAWFNDGDWIKAHSSATSDWMNWFERAWFDEVEKSHNVKEVKKPHNTVAKEMKNPHTDDVDFAPQLPYSNTGHTVQPNTADVDQIDNPHSNDLFNLIKVSGGKELKSLNFSAVDVTKASNSNGPDVALHELNAAISHSYGLNVKDLDKMATLILDHLYDLGRCNKHSHDPGELNPKQVSIKMKFGLLTRNDKDVSA